MQKSPPHKSQSLQRCKPLLGTYVEISVSGDYSRSDLIQLSEIGFAEIRRIQSLMNFHDEKSELSQINNSPIGKWIDLSEDMLSVFRAGLDLYRLSNGVFDFTFISALKHQQQNPSLQAQSVFNSSSLEIEGSKLRLSNRVTIDLGGIAKGYAVDCALVAIQQAAKDIKAGINGGGDICFSHPKDEIVQIRIPSPHAHDRFTQYHPQLPAVATSAAYFTEGSNHSAIVNPFMQKQIPMKDLSITVNAPNCMIADGLTKIVAISENPTSILQAYNSTAYCVNAAGKIDRLGLES